MQAGSNRSRERQRDTTNKKERKNNRTEYVHAAIGLQLHHVFVEEVRRAAIIERDEHRGDECCVVDVRDPTDPPLERVHEVVSSALAVVGGERTRVEVGTHARVIITEQVLGRVTTRYVSVFLVPVIM